MLLEYKMIQMYNQVQLHCENHILRTGNTYSKSLQSHKSFFLRQAIMLPRLALN